MIDLHSHILPNMDDGSDSPETSRRMLQMLWDQGVDIVAATPHFYAAKDTPESFLLRRAEAYKMLELDSQRTPRVILGAEVAYFDGMSHCRELTKLQLGASGCILVEMPYSIWTDRMVTEVCSLSQIGRLPILAHVNRYHSQIRRYGARLLAEGVYFQCNAEAFLPAMDRGWAMNRLKKGQLQFLGSDCHNLTTRKPNIGRAADIITKKLGDDILEEMDAAARHILKL